MEAEVRPVTDLDAIVAELGAHAEEDIVDVAWLIGAVRARDPAADDVELRELGVEVARRLIDRGIDFGTFVDAEFVAWPSDTAAERLDSEWRELGREPTLGDIGCFKDPRLDYRPAPPQPG